LSRTYARSSSAEGRIWYSSAAADAWLLRLTRKRKTCRNSRNLFLGSAVNLDEQTFQVGERLKTEKLETAERELIEAAQKDPRRFGELYERNFDRVYGYVTRRVQDHAAAEDVTSEVFQQALANIRRFEWRGVPFIAWLYRIAANAIADRSARSGREQGEAPEEVVDESAMQEVEARAALYEMVRSLAGDQQRVIVARFVEEKSVREIAHELGRSEGAVKQLQFRALENLRKRMEGANG
jgi:RNA polymerase sigma-70 factor (ECF subfamily)